MTQRSMCTTANPVIKCNLVFGILEWNGRSTEVIYAPDCTGTQFAVTRHLGYSLQCHGVRAGDDLHKIQVLRETQFTDGTHLIWLIGRAGVL
jgi:hypothetical protein